MRHSHTFDSFANVFKLIQYAFQLIVLYAMIHWHTKLISSIQFGCRKNNGKPLEQKFVKYEQQNTNSYRFWDADYKYDHIKENRCVFCRLRWNRTDSCFFKSVFKT